MDKCPFCGSVELLKETPYVDPITKKKKTSWCCKAQAKNREYLDKKYSRTYSKKMDIEDTYEL